MLVMRAIAIVIADVELHQSDIIVLNMLFDCVLEYAEIGIGGDTKRPPYAASCGIAVAVCGNRWIGGRRP